jgi:hypothetical protein
LWRSERAKRNRNFNDFAADLNASAIPQWAFVTPNMVDDGHGMHFSGAPLLLSDGSWLCQTLPLHICLAGLRIGLGRCWLTRASMVVIWTF